MNPKLLLFSVILAVGIIGSGAARMFILDDGEFANVRYRRDLDAKAPLAPLAQPLRAPAPKRPLQYDPIPPGDENESRSDSYGGGGGGGYGHGRVGPVYTFVKTDPYAHVKWGVRHVAGSQYAGR